MASPTDAPHAGTGLAGRGQRRSDAPGARSVGAALTSAGPAHAADCDLPGRLADVRQRIAAAACRAGRAPASVTLVAVSKGVAAEAILEARRAGQADFGENRAQDLTRKSEAVGQGVRWHFIGRLQRSKVRTVVGSVSLVHSVDRLELAEAIADHARRAARVQRVLVQVNVAGDPAKGGCDPDEALGLVARVRALPGIACQGLMTVPGLDEDPRPAFAELRALRDAVRERFPEVQHLSMGMSHDYEIAVEEGATIVRIGTALFGPRGTPAARQGAR